MANHHQTLDRLAERGGLDCRELYAVINDRDIWKVLRTVSKDQAKAEIDRLLGTF